MCAKGLSWINIKNIMLMEKNIIPWDDLNPKSCLLIQRCHYRNLKSYKRPRETAWHIGKGGVEKRLQITI